MPPRTSFVAGPTEKARGREYPRCSRACRSLGSPGATDWSGPSSGTSVTGTGASWWGWGGRSCRRGGGPPVIGGTGTRDVHARPWLGGRGHRPRDHRPDGRGGPGRGRALPEGGGEPHFRGGDGDTPAVTATVPAGTAVPW